MSESVSQESVIEATNDIIEYLKEELGDTEISFEDFSYNVVQNDLSLDISLILDLIINGVREKTPYTIRFSKNAEIYQNERSLYEELKKRVGEIENLNIEEMILYDDSSSRIVYKGTVGTHLNELDPLYSNFLLGTISSMIHGDTVSDLDFKPLRETFNILLNNLPFEKEDCDELKSVIDKRFDGMKRTFSGYLPLTQIQKENIVVELEKSIEEIDLYSLSKLIGLKVIIPMRVPRFEVKDRLNDLGVHFSEEAFNHYIETKDLEEIKGNLESFISGYSSSLYERTGVRIKNLYPDGLTLDLQLILNLWITEATKLDINNVDKERMKDIVDFTKLVLNPQFTKELLLTEM